MVAKFVVLAALVAIAHAGIVGPHAGGTSVSSRQQDDHGNYAFHYQINDGASTHGRSEAGNKAGVVGSYNLGIIDGRSRKVDYVADGHGFRAKVATNEQGTALSAPASAVIASPYTGSVAVGHGVAHAPVAVAPAAAIAPAVAVAAPAAYGAYGAAPVGAYGVAGLGGIGGIGGYGLGHGVGAYGLGAGAYGAGALGLGAYGAGAYGHGGYAGYGLGKHVIG